MDLQWLGGAIAHLLSLTGRLGVSVALTAGVLYLLRSKGFAFTAIPDEWANSIFIAGLWGLAVAVVSFVVWSAQVSQRVFSAGRARWKARAVRRKRQERAVKQLWSAERGEYQMVGAYLNLRGTRTFKAGRYNTLLKALVDDGILVIDDLPGDEHNQTATYVVPDYIRMTLKEHERHLKSLPAQNAPPWNKFEPDSRWVV